MVVGDGWMDGWMGWMGWMDGREGKGVGIANFKFTGERLVCGVDVGGWW